MSNIFLNNNSDSNYSLLDKIHAKLCGRVYLFLYKLTSICEDKKLKRDISLALKKAEENAQRVEYIDEQKETILGGFEALKERIFELENELEACRLREKMVGNYRDEIAYLYEIIERVFVLSRMGNVQEINQFLIEITKKEGY